MGAWVENHRLAPSGMKEGVLGWCYLVCYLQCHFGMGIASGGVLVGFGVLFAGDILDVM